jgi:hypothetical protein
LALEDKSFDLGIVREDFHKEWRPLYNSGVMLFRKEAPFLLEWHKECEKQSGIMMGDQDVLSALIIEGKIKIRELPTAYNWLMYAGIHPGIIIAHWASDWGKEYIRKFGGVHALLERALPEA